MLVKVPVQQKTGFTKTYVLNPYKNYNTLPVPKLHQFQLLCLIHNFFHDTHCLFKLLYPQYGYSQL